VKRAKGAVHPEEKLREMADTKQSMTKPSFKGRRPMQVCKTCWGKKNRRINQLTPRKLQPPRKEGVPEAEAAMSRNEVILIRALYSGGVVVIKTEKERV